MQTQMLIKQHLKNFKHHVTKVAYWRSKQGGVLSWVVVVKICCIALAKALGNCLQDTGIIHSDEHGTPLHFARGINTPDAS